MKSMASPELQLTSPKGTKIPVWAHFRFQLGNDGKVADEKHLVCKICQAKVGYSWNTTSLKQHLQSCQSDMLINQLINRFNHGNYRY